MARKSSAVLEVAPAAAPEPVMVQAAPAYTVAKPSKEAKLKEKLATAEKKRQERINLIKAAIKQNVANVKQLKGDQRRRDKALRATNQALDKVIAKITKLQSQLDATQAGN